MRFLIIGIVVVFGALSARAEEAPATLEELVKQAREERILEEQALRAREQEFRAAHDRQQALLEKLRVELLAERKLGEELKRRYTENEAEIKTKSAGLQEKTGSLKELFGVARQVAKDTQSLVHASLVSAQKPGREALPTQLAERKDNPSLEELESLWLLLLGEMVEAGTASAREYHHLGDQKWRGLDRPPQGRHSGAARERRKAARRESGERGDHRRR